MKRFSESCWLTPLCALVMGGVASAAHPFHETVTEIQFSAERGGYEIAIKAYPEELEAAVSAAQRKRFVLGRGDSEKRLQQYLARALQVRWGPKVGRMQWVGFEDSVNEVWMYVVWAPPEETKSDAPIVLANRLLFELYDDQSNIVVRIDGKRRTATTLSPNRWKLKLKPR